MNRSRSSDDSYHSHSESSSRYDEEYRRAESVGDRGDGMMIAEDSDELDALEWSSWSEASEYHDAHDESSQYRIDHHHGHRHRVAYSQFGNQRDRRR